jgi:hypothetical protein
MKFVAVLLLLALSACTKKPDPAPPPAKKPETKDKFKRGEGEPDRIEIQVILISFKGVRGVKATRSIDEARELAAKVLEQARAGADFQLLVDLHSEPAVHSPGVYGVTNFGVTPVGNEKARSPGVLGDVAFKLQVGEAGMADYDPQKNPAGWWIVKRVK